MSQPNLLHVLYAIIFVEAIVISFVFNSRVNCDAENTSALASIRETGLTFKPEFHGFEMMVSSHYAPKAPKQLDVTWVTQMTLDRLGVFTHLLQAWKGPMTVVIYTKHAEDDFLVLQPYMNGRIDFHLVHSGEGLYPVNALRNVAMDKVRTEYFIVCDVDFIPNHDAYDLVQPELQRWLENKKKVYVLPAFQMFGKAEMPKSKKELLPLYASGDINQVHPDPGRKIAHSYTDYKKWSQTDEEYEVTHTFPYEPYFIAHHSVVRFDPRFIGYGNDKAVHCQEMATAGFRFMVWPNGFITHKDHPQGAWLQRSYQSFDTRMKLVMTGFFADMQRRYQPLVPIVEPESDEWKIIAGLQGDSCDSTCNIHGMKCDSEGDKYVNTCAALERKFLCNGGCVTGIVGPELPNYDVAGDRCLAIMDRTQYPFSCSTFHQSTARLCPCRGSPWASKR